MTAAIVIGYGSIGQRHVRVLRDLGCDVAVVSRRKVDHPQVFASLGDAFSARRPDYVVVASETSAHAMAVEELLRRRYAGRLLIEKPLGEMPRPVFDASFELAAVGYNLRFHPAMITLADALVGQRPISMQAYCGQYLPDWRPGTDFRESYSADPARGGGVLRDLSHELDYLLWLGGAWRTVAALGGHISPLEIKSDDCWALLLALDRCPAVSVQVNYLDRPGRRQIVVNTAEHTFVADLIRNTLTRDGREQAFTLEPDHTYRAQHRAILSGDTSRLCTLADADQVMKLIAAAERAAKETRWMPA
jgi:predicted dehydrogenase